MQTEARVGVAAVARRQEQRHIGTAAHLASGGFAGAVSKTCTAPLARLTILFQVLAPSSRVAGPAVLGRDWEI
jgi:solute carrier family 25 (mitochondrial phosphate transporter), member 23/24/25/41